MLLITKPIGMNRTIWIIDDDLVSQFATRYCIEQYDEVFSIETFENAEAGLVAASELKAKKKPLPHIIFLDLIMDNMNGWEFIDNLLLLADGMVLPDIYVLSAFVRAKDSEIAKKHQVVSGYFDKPITRMGLNKIFTNKVPINP